METRCCLRLGLTNHDFHKRRAELSPRILVFFFAVGGQFELIEMADRRVSYKDVLERYRDYLLNAKAEEMARLFHPGFTYIINGEKNAGSHTFCQVATWEGIFSKVEYFFAQATEVHEPFPGHLVYKEELRLRIKNDARDELIGLFEDELVVDAEGTIVLILRKADPAFFAALYKFLQ